MSRFAWCQWGQAIWSWLWAKRPCMHAHWDGSTAHCPTCGQAVSAQWAVMRCTGCHRRRAPRLISPHVAVQPHCHHCGGEATYWQLQADIEAFEAPFAIRTVKAPVWARQTRVWADASSTASSVEDAIFEPVGFPG